MDETQRDRRMDDTQKELKKVDTKVESIADDVKTILILLTGTKYDESQGLINRFEKETMENSVIFERFEKRLKDLEKLKDRIFYIGIGMGLSTGGALTAVLYTLFGKK